MGNRLQTRSGDDDRRVVVRLTASYLAIFLLVIGALSVLAYFLVAAQYRGALGPALDVPEGVAALGIALRRVVLSILALDAALAIVVGAASYALAKAAIGPLVEARAREARFAADVAHELRTPLGVMASVAQAAHKDPVAHPDALTIVSDQALEASRLIADLLTLARNPHARALSCEPVDVAAIAARAVREHEEAATAAGIAIGLDAQSAIVDGDERRLAQLFRNLLDNALRYARSHVEVTVGVDGGEARIVIADDGPGVSDGVRRSVFERFAKGANSEGSGLGLAICRWVARSHGGEIGLEGTSSFVTRLPLGNYGVG